MGKKGRPAKSGARYACGKLKPTGDPISGAAWQRVREDAVRAIRDARLGSALGRLSFHKEITDAQAEAGFRVGLIYGLFERDHVGKPRHARSPSYEIGLSGSGGVAEELMEGEVLRDRVRRERASLEAFQALQDELRLLDPRLRRLVEDLCVDDRAPAAYELDAVRAALDHLVSFFGRSQSRKKRKARPARSAYIAHAVAGGAQTRTRAEIARAACEQFVRALRPDYEPEQVREASQMLAAMLERERERDANTLRKRGL